LSAVVVAMALALLLSLFTIARLATHQTQSAAAAATATQSRQARQGDMQTITTSSTDAASESTPTAPPRPTAAATGSPPFPGQPQTDDSGDSEPDAEAVARSVAGSTSGRQSPEESEASPLTSSSSPVGLVQPPADGVRLDADKEIPDERSVRSQLPAEPRIFVEKITLSNGETLELGGIAWSATGPYALLDERVVGLGETIKGYMVTRIAPQEVELEGGDGVILLRLK
jgi:type II secretory pathway pseudopilin PulG